VRAGCGFRGSFDGVAAHEAACTYAYHRTEASEETAGMSNALTKKDQQVEGAGVAGGGEGLHRNSFSSQLRGAERELSAAHRATLAAEDISEQFQEVMMAHASRESGALGGIEVAAHGSQSSEEFQKAAEAAADSEEAEKPARNTANSLELGIRAPLGTSLDDSSRTALL